MGLENYRDLSAAGSDINAGFQFEFSCTNCSRKWKSPFKPYRMGQISGFFGRFAFLISDGAKAGRFASGAADYGARNAKAAALQEAMVSAEKIFSSCGTCKKGFCEDCLDNRNQCEGCRKEGDLAHGGNSSQPSAHACPNCGTGSNGGRFCAECGFDMASTHKSCPGCGTLTERAARFCGDCGHGF